MNIPSLLPVLLKDGYKVGHKFQYPDGTTLVYSNFTARKSRRESPGIIWFGLQAFVLEYLIKEFNSKFFIRRKDEVVKAYKRRIDNYLGPGTPVSHIAALHDLQYLPLHIKSLPEGTLVPHNVPCLTIRNTKPEFFWLTNMLETLLSCQLWGPSTSATTAFMYRKVFEKYAKETGANRDFCKWQGHDFSFRGMFGVEAALLSGAGHLLSFTGTDTIPAIDFLEEYYDADCEKELIGGSVPATEHSVMSMGMKEGEIETFKRLITKTYPKGIVSIVSDTWDFWKVLTEYLPSLRQAVLARDGKVVIRPDSGDPVKIICGDPVSSDDVCCRGAIQCLWDVFGGTVNARGFKELDPHIGLIYGDSITLERQDAILSGLRAKGFASSNVVLGIGSFTYQHATRDTEGWAMKATYGEKTTFVGGDDHDINNTGWITEGQAIWKDPKTDDGTKKSHKGLLCVGDHDLEGPSEMFVTEECGWTATDGHGFNGEDRGILETVFLDGDLKRRQTLSEIRTRVEGYL